MSRTIVKKGPKKALPPFEFDLRYKGQRRTISIPAEGHTPQTAHQAAAKQLREEVDAEMAERDHGADDEDLATDDIPEPPTPAPVPSVAPPSDEVASMRAEMAQMKESMAEMRQQIEAPEMAQIVSMISTLNQNLASVFAIEERINTLTSRVDSALLDFEQQEAAFQGQRQEAIEAHQAAIAVAKSGAEMMSKLNSQAAQTVNSARQDQYDAQISAQVLSEALLEQHITGQVAPSPVLQPPPQNPYRPEPRPSDNTPPPVAVDPHEQPTTPPPPAYSAGMQLPEENPALAAQLAAATQERMEAGDAG